MAVGVGVAKAREEQRRGGGEEEGRVVVGSVHGMLAGYCGYCVDCNKSIRV